MSILDGLLRDAFGVSLIRGGSAAEMQALTGVGDGSVFLVNAGTAIQGLYIFRRTSSLTPDNALVYAATGMGSGNWVHELHSLLNANLGIAAIGPIAGSSGIAASKLKASVVPNVVLGMETFAAYVGYSTTSSSYAEVPSVGVSLFNCQMGDILLTYGHATMRGSAQAVVGAARVRVVDSGANFDDTSSGASFQEQSANLDSTHAIPLHKRYWVTGPGTVAVKLMVSGTTGATVVLDRVNMTVLHIRP
jgi:hypothetical protein